MLDLRDSRLPLFTKRPMLYTHRVSPTKPTWSACITQLAWCSARQDLASLSCPLYADTAGPVGARPAQLHMCTRTAGYSGLVSWVSPHATVMGPPCVVHSLCGSQERRQNEVLLTRCVVCFDGRRLHLGKSIPMYITRPQEHVLHIHFTPVAVSGICLRRVYFFASRT